MCVHARVCSTDRCSKEREGEGERECVWGTECVCMCVYMHVYVVLTGAVARWRRVVLLKFLKSQSDSPVS